MKRIIMPHQLFTVLITVLLFHTSLSHAVEPQIFVVESNQTVVLASPDLSVISGSGTGLEAFNIGGFQQPNMHPQGRYVAFAGHCHKNFVPRIWVTDLDDPNRKAVAVSPPGVGAAYPAFFYGDNGSGQNISKIVYTTYDSVDDNDWNNGSNVSGFVAEEPCDNLANIAMVDHPDYIGPASFLDRTGMWITLAGVPPRGQVAVMDFSANASGDIQVSNLTVRTEAGNKDFRPTFSPDGQYITFTTPRRNN